jgi:hypothetical protein
MLTEKIPLIYLHILCCYPASRRAPSPRQPYCAARRNLQPLLAQKVRLRTQRHAIIIARWQKVRRAREFGAHGARRRQTKALLSYRHGGEIGKCLYAHHCYLLHDDDKCTGTQQRASTQAHAYLAGVGGKTNWLRATVSLTQTLCLYVFIKGSSMQDQLVTTVLPAALQSGLTDWQSLWKFKSRSSAFGKFHGWLKIMETYVA